MPHRVATIGIGHSVSPPIEAAPTRRGRMIPYRP